jgi:hypothetical protein
MRSIWAVTGLTVALACGSSVLPLSAHHSFGLYDMTKSAEVEGTVSKFEWSNPHCWLFIKVAGADGAEVDYGFEMASVGEVIRRGWTKSALKSGDRVRVQYHPLRDGKPAGILMTATVNGNLIGRPIGAPNAQPTPQPPAADSATPAR